MNSKLKMLKLKINKELNAIKEDFDLDDYINYKLKNIKIEKEPFEYVILDNFFKEDFYKDICSFFEEVYKKGFEQVKDDNKLHPFLDIEYPYDGYVKSIFPFENKICNIIYSNQFNLFLSNIFKRETSNIVSPAFHFHPPHDKTGWVHNDYADKSFSTKNILYNGILAHARHGDKAIKNDITEKRAISLIYYFDNELSEEDGGGTGFYKNVGDKMPIKIIVPKNNRLLLFSVSPKSYHAFQQNKKDRKSMVLWLHTDIKIAEDIFNKDKSLK